MSAVQNETDAMSDSGDEPVFLSEQDGYITLDVDENEEFSSDEDEVKTVHEASALKDVDSSRISSNTSPASASPSITLREATDSLCSVSVHPQFPIIPHVATGGCDDTCRVYNFSQLVECDHGRFATPLKTLNEAADTVSCLAYSNDGLYLAAGCCDASLRIYKVDPSDNSQSNAYHLLHNLYGPSGDIEWIQWHPKGPGLVAGSADSTVWMWWVPNGRMMRIFSGHGSRVTCGSFTFDGKGLCTASDDGCIIIWSAATGKMMHKLGRPFRVREADGSDSQNPAVNGVVALATHKLLPLLATGSLNGTCKLIHIESGKTLSHLNGHADSVEALCFFDDTLDKCFGPQAILATGGLDGMINIWDCSKMTIRCKLDTSQLVSFNNLPSSGGITRISWFPRGLPVILSVTTEGFIFSWDCRSGVCKQILNGHDGAILDMCVFEDSIDSPLIHAITVGDDHAGNIWDFDCSYLLSHNTERIKNFAIGNSIS
ncbi:WD domain, G-beta repeat-containing protein [Cardiosporidium cionae]|uniref:WD domain, G-beta repeat-containing protein n=1 Tax=Cardiosporidium cionae TaxID=476202 RepID=A0ABQ7J4C4_9APIC|nr:WD domain, G-beta repeat-containing protein [Cardiosporidium cionae]|eukprot:KAF8817939.1 WD domain, G-beta repeat-containing protein [Cardiosporidium cionae]